MNVNPEAIRIRNSDRVRRIEVHYLRAAKEALFFSLLFPRPLPVPDLGLVDSLGVGVFNTLDDLRLQPFFEMCSRTLKLWDPVDDVDGQVEAVDLVADGEF